MPLCQNPIRYNSRVGVLMVDIEQLKRWRLILGKSAEETLRSLCTGDEGLQLNRDDVMMDEALAAIYDETRGTGFMYTGFDGKEKSAGSGPSVPKLAKWLADIRACFPEDVVSVIQSDAMKRKGLKELLFEPEVLKNIKPNIEMAKTLMLLKEKIPVESREVARQIVKTVVDEINRRLKNDLEKAVTGALNKKKHSHIPNSASIDWKYTINRNLKNYSLEHKKIIPERFYFFERIRRTNNWDVILDMDQSGSMAGSIIYGTIAGSIFASMAVVNTRIVAFDTEVVDLTEKFGNDPVDMLFGIQLGGGTDINKSVAYCQQFIANPARTLFILISDLYEDGDKNLLISRMEDLFDSGVKVICLLALSDSGFPSYNSKLARRFSRIGIPCFACTPNVLPDLIEGALKGKDLNEIVVQGDRYLIP